MENPCRMHIFGKKEGRTKSYAKGRIKTGQFYLWSLPFCSPFHNLWIVLHHQNRRAKVSFSGDL